jgi:hypothetical protein
MRRPVARAILVAAALGCVFVRPAHAYIDPGTGSYILQTCLGIAFGALYTLKIYWRQVTAFFSRSRSDKPLADK